ncbi:30S ribosomal protein S7 [Candidatus Phytoplasma mali]|uniref:Small ribosomal subunit protein uS7 n=3 Tax=Apple proliferation phytoplasma TaxID=37692 RepID=RS7_PHYMT|nr:30S ribosomal protein S7 [Candidatus Phytoplasma mali]B3QZH3.1 RecName: Full=Small ribosomal subunit protein uS7; AltName: Full=30S ribosomal protein S7 [Candidatus Phytoplasma mali AT]CAP18580.1 30S ribosomal protein S7 [Candidatus Phytoplasma mali]
MPRKKSINKRDVLPDVFYNSKLVTKTINTIMKDGKKATAQAILYGAFNKVKEITQREPIIVFDEALKNIMPELEVRSRRIGGQKYQIPSEVRPERKQSLGLRWLVQFAQKRNEKTMQQKLAKEIIDAASGNGLAVKKREEIHRMAEANKSFAHYRW